MTRRHRGRPFRPDRRVTPNSVASPVESAPAATTSPSAVVTSAFTSSLCRAARPASDRRQSSRPRDDSLTTPTVPSYPRAGKGTAVNTPPSGADATRQACGARRIRASQAKAVVANSSIATMDALHDRGRRIIECGPDRSQEKMIPDRRASRAHDAAEDRFDATQERDDLVEIAHGSSGTQDRLAGDVVANDHDDTLPPRPAVQQLIELVFPVEELVVVAQQIDVEAPSPCLEQRIDVGLVLAPTRVVRQGL